MLFSNLLHSPHGPNCKHCIAFSRAAKANFCWIYELTIHIATLYAIWKLIVCSLQFGMMWSMEKVQLFKKDVQSQLHRDLLGFCSCDSNLAIFEVTQFWKQTLHPERVWQVEQKPGKNQSDQMLPYWDIALQSFHMCWHQHLLQFWHVVYPSTSRIKDVSVTILFRCSYSSQVSNLFWSVAVFLGNINDWISWSKLCIEFNGQTFTDCLTWS